MNRSEGLAHRLAPWLLAAALAGCAAKPIPPPIAQTSPLLGRSSTGTIVSVRPVVLSSNGNEVSTILAALGEPPAAPASPANELVIRRADASITSIIQPAGGGQPSFSPGEAVAIDEAAATVVRPQ
jgi:outer membrane lipoprotein SlyB